MGIFTRPAERDGENQLKSAAYNAPRPITAAAQPVNIADKTELASLNKRRQAQVWQDQAWEYYDLIGEVKYSANFVASVVSRIRLFPGYVTDDDLAPAALKDIQDIEDDLKADVQRVMRKIGTGNGGVPGMLQDAALNLFIAGECYLVQEPAKIGSKQPERWSIRSVKEIVTRGGKGAGMFIKPSKTSSQNEQIKLPDRAAVQRIWRMHPAFSADPDSSMLGLLELMDELLLNNKSARGAAKSQLNAGLITIPDDMSNSSQSDGEVDDDPDTMADFSDDETDSFEEDLLNAFITPIADEGSAASVAPMPVRGPIDALNAIRHITFDRKFDETSALRAEKVMDRILAGLDIPKEIVQGIADAKYANAVQVEETLYKAHIEPMALLLCDALTDSLLHPMLRAYGWAEEDIENIVVWYDPSAITAKPSKAEAATIGYDKRLLSGDAWRRANGFSDTDAPKEIELGQRVALDRGVLSEPLTEALFYSLLPELIDKVRTEQQALSPGAGAVAQALDGGEPTSGAPSQLIEPDSAPTAPPASPPGPSPVGPAPTLPLIEP